MDNLRGALLMVLAMLAFAIEDVLIKIIAEGLSIGQILLMLGIFGSAVFGVNVKVQGRFLLDRSLMTTPILIRAIGEVVGTLGFVSAIVLTSLSSASAILQATPLVVTLGAALFLRESVGWRRWSAVLVGLFGVLLILRPGMADFEPLSLLAVLGVLGLAARDLATRRVPPSTSTMQLSFLGYLVIIPTGLAHAAGTGSGYVLPAAAEWLYFFAALVTGLFAYYAIVAAMRIGDVSFVTPFRYSRLIFAMIFGVAVFAEQPDALTLLGAAIIVTSGIYTVWRERMLARSDVAKPVAPR